jgi:ABC transporter DrrB family efflux protein
MTPTDTLVHVEPEARPQVPRDDTEPSRSGTPPLWRNALVFAGRNIQHIRQIPEKLLDVTAQPLMFVLLFAFVFGGAIGISDGNYREYMLGGILLQSLAFGLVGPATSIATDLTEGVIDRFRSLPASRASYLLGHYIAELTGMVLSILVIVAAGLVVGWRVRTGVAEVALAGVLLLAFASSMIWIGTWVGLKVRAPDAVMGIAFTLVFPLTFISNAFVPVDSLPSVLEFLASWNPMSVMVSAIRELFGNPVAPVSDPSWPLAHPVLAAFLYCGVLLAIAVPMSLRRYRARTIDA